MDTPRSDLRMPHLPALDGLRAVALVAVLCFHAGFGWISGGYLPLTSFFVLSGFLITALLLLERGRTGRVSLKTFWARRARRLAPGALLGMGAAIAYTASVASPGRLGELRADVLSSLAYVTNWRFIADGQTYGDLFAEPSALQHFWSLAVEEQFYLLFPLVAVGLLAAARGRRILLGAFAGAGVVASTLWMRHLFEPGDAPLRVYFGTDTRAAEILVGVLLAVLLVGPRGLRTRTPSTPMSARCRRLLDVAGLAALAVTVTSWFVVHEYDDRLYEGGLVVIALLAALVVAAATVPGGLTGRVLGVWPLAALGKVSYGVYLFHWPVFLWLTEERTGLPTVSLFTVRMAVTMVLAVGSYVLVEQPVRNGRGLRWPVAPAAWANASVALCAVLVLVTANPATPSTTFDLRTALPDGPPPTAPVAHVGEIASPTTAAGGPSTTAGLDGSAAPSTTAVAGAPGATPAPTGAPGPASGSRGAGAVGATSRDGVRVAAEPAPGAAPSRTSAPTTAPARTGPVRIMVVGDSLGQNLGRALERWAKRTGKAVVWDLSLPGCPVTRGGVRRVEGDKEWPVAEACGWWSTGESRTRLESFRPDVVFMHTGHNELYDRRGVAPWGDEWHGPGEAVFDDWLRSEWRGAANAFATTGAKVAWAVPPCVDAARSPGLVSDSEANRRLGHLRPAVPAMAAAGAVSSVDLHGTICPGGRFSNTVMGVEDARPDGFHIVDAAADVLVERWLAPMLLDLGR